MCTGQARLGQARSGQVRSEDTLRRREEERKRGRDWCKYIKHKGR